MWGGGGGGGEWQCPVHLWLLHPWSDGGVDMVPSGPSPPNPGTTFLKQPSRLQYHHHPAPTHTQNNSAHPQDMSRFCMETRPGFSVCGVADSGRHVPATPAFNRTPRSWGRHILKTQLPPSPPLPPRRPEESDYSPAGLPSVCAGEGLPKPSSGWGGALEVLDSG